MINRIALLTLITSTLAVTPALADANKGFYIGGGIGAAAFSSPDLEDDADDLGGSIDFDHSGLAYNIYTGYQFNRIIALELSYNNYADTKVKLDHPSTKPTEGEFATEGMSLSANLGYTFNNGLRPFALVGLGYISNDNYFDDGQVSYHGGGGLDYTPNALPNLTFRAAYLFDFYELDLEDDHTAISGMVMAGAAYRF
ncbi:outer membrane beta-barrel protein [Vibrio algivorus]|uniref:Membrane protein n=1 Tax=Vibrio algivorus TaxID=1667024 RepID=A0ABQ6EPC8_9VIBR|nr:outer membrane beta-barrel protein [Vibrio algivorus]GLT14995.1 membrane protein [Vibrio algivorus]